jgi:hypothetical protein
MNGDGFITIGVNGLFAAHKPQGNFSNGEQNQGISMLSLSLSLSQHQGRGEEDKVKMKGETRALALVFLAHKCVCGKNSMLVATAGRCPKGRGGGAV